LHPQYGHVSLWIHWKPFTIKGARHALIAYLIHEGFKFLALLPTRPLGGFPPFTVRSPPDFVIVFGMYHEFRLQVIDLPSGMWWKFKPQS
jgi:hypothetical protein